MLPTPGEAQRSGPFGGDGARGAVPVKLVHHDLEGAGRRVRYWTGGGDGPWLVVCHGMAHDHRDLVPLLEDLPAWRLLFWDMPGHGESQPQPGSHDLEMMCDAFEAVLADAGVERPVILGFSFGGMLAQAHVRRHPDRVAGLILYGCFAPYSQAPIVPVAMAGMVAGLMRLKSWAALKRAFVAKCARRPESRALIAESMEPLGREGFIGMTRALIEAFRPDASLRILCPTFLVRGDADSNGAALDKAEAALLALQPAATVARIPAAGHCAHLDNPEALRREVRAFLAGL
jgi:3-oxoadipate enol-lactonase